MAMLRGKIRFQTIVCVPKKLWLFPWFSDKEIDDNWCVYNLQTRMMINQCFARTFPHFQETKNLHPPSPDPLSWSQAFLYLFRQEGTGEMAVLTGIVQHEGDRNRGITSAIAVQLQTYQWHFCWILTGLWFFYVLLMLFLFFGGWLLMDHSWDWWDIHGLWSSFWAGRVSQNRLMGFKIGLNHLFMEYLWD